MRILVTGGSGFIGSYVVRELLTHKTPHDIVSASRSHCCQDDDFRLRDEHLHTLKEYHLDVAKDEQVKRLMKGFEPEAVFHLAANPLVKSEDVETNVLGTCNLLKHCPRGARFAFASSATVYGDSGRVSEDDALCPNSVYGAAKAASEQFVHAHTLLGRVRGICFRLVANVGGGATHGLLPDVVAKLKSDFPTLCLIGDRPGSIKPFSYVRDTARFVVDAGLNPSVLGPVNVSPAAPISVERVAELVMATTGIRKPVEWLGQKANWAGDNRLVIVDTDRAYRFGYRPQYPSSEEAIVAAAKEMM